MKNIVDFPSKKYAGSAIRTFGTTCMYIPLNMKVNPECTKSHFFDLSECEMNLKIFTFI